VSTIVITIHVIVSLILILSVLLQSGKSADLAGAFGGGGSQTAFGPRGAASLLSRITTICAVLFMVTSLGLWIISAAGTRSVISGEPAPKETPAAVETEKSAGEADESEKPGTVPPEKKEDSGTTGNVDIE
jgi:preprotein translocase subunit SecG